MTALNHLLASAYGISAWTIAPTSGGFSANAYRVACAGGAAYFLKEYDASLPTTKFYVDRIDAYTPVLHALCALPDLRGRVLTPVRALSGAYKVVRGANIYALFLFAHGSVPGIDGMTQAQTIELAHILARLHDVPLDGLPGLTHLAEDVSMPFCDRLRAYMNETRGDSLVSGHEDMLTAALDELSLFGDKRAQCPSRSLCHGDAHGNNVIQGERLVLADWEDLRIAPPEADLFIHAWHPHGETLLSAYKEARPGYAIDRDLMRLYVIRRRIEDIAVDVQRLTEESPDEAERIETIGYIRQSLDGLPMWLNPS